MKEIYIIPLDWTNAYTEIELPRKKKKRREKERTINLRLEQPERALRGTAPGDTRRASFAVSSFRGKQALSGSVLL